MMEQGINVQNFVSFNEARENNFLHDWIWYNAYLMI